MEASVLAGSSVWPVGGPRRFHEGGTFEDPLGLLADQDSDRESLSHVLSSIRFAEL